MQTTRKEARSNEQSWISTGYGYEAGLSKSDAEKALNAFVEVVGGELGKGGKVQLHSVRLK